MKKNLKIIVEGEPNSGKSTVRLFIADLLREKGLDVIIEPTVDHPTEELARSVYSKNKLDMIKDHIGSIEIHEVFKNRDKS